LAASTLLLLIEVLVAAGIVLAGVLTRSGPLALLGGGLLMGMAIQNILGPEGGSIYRRALIGYSVAAVFVVGGFILLHFAA
jgi:hypothetical protein